MEAMCEDSSDFDFTSYPVGNIWIEAFSGWETHAIAKARLTAQGKQ